MSKQNTVTMDCSIDGLYESNIEYQYSNATCQFKWRGPEIPKDEWRQVMEFFKWTQKQHNSEAQVLGYVNAMTNQIKFWAPRQIGGTGMTSRSPDSPEKQKELLERFPPGEGWRLWMSVHHHVTASAFQSGTDLHDELEQFGQGLHITLGHLDKPTWSFHARAYVRRVQVPLNIYQFWQVDDAVAGRLKSVIKLFSESAIVDALNNQTIAEMTDAKDITGDGGFPGEWRKNYIIEERRLPAIPLGKFSHYQGHFSNYDPFAGDFPSHDYVPQVPESAHGQLPAHKLTEVMEQLETVCYVKDLDPHDVVNVIGGAAEVIDLIYTEGGDLELVANDLATLLEREEQQEIIGEIESNEQ